MGERRFLHVGFKWTEAPKNKEIEEVFNKASDWVRYSTHCWILWTKVDPSTWYLRLRPHLAENDYVLIAELNLSEVNTRYSGWQPKMVWEWIQKHQ